MSSIFRVDSRMFMRLFVLFNVVLALYNFLSFRLATNDTIPCTIVISSNSSSLSLTGPLIPEMSIGSNGAVSGRLLKRGKYYVLANYVLANRTFNGNESITLTTQGSASFLKHAEPLCQRWGGPLSVAVYVDFGGAEASRALRIIRHLRSCGNACIKQNVTWHFIMQSDATWPEERNGSVVYEKPSLKLPSEWSDPLEYNCSAVNTTAIFEKGTNDEGSRKVGHGYPINVVRNVARSLAKTFYVLASDIELYPSTNIIPRFLKMVSLEALDPKSNKGPHVYVLPIFEVNKEEKAPENKATLAKLLEKKRAVYFHKWVCDACQNFPGRDNWVKSFPINDTLGVHAKTKRNRSRSSWEPIYIGTNSEPFYEEGLSWEGKRDKMSQMFEMCMLDYTMYILDNAFLVHAPGIKVIKLQEEKRRYPFMRENNLVYEKAMQAIRKKYSKRRLPC